jgi:hypothetical protein
MMFVAITTLLIVLYSLIECDTKQMKNQLLVRKQITEALSGTISGSRNRLEYLKTNSIALYHMTLPAEHSFSQ